MARFLPALATAGAILIAAAIAIALLAAPRPKQAYFTIVCDTAALPEAITVNFDDIPQAHVRNAEATVSNVRAARTLAPHPVTAGDSIDRVALKPREGSAGTASFLLHPTGRLGVQMLKAARGARVSAEKRPDGGLDLIVQASTAGSTVLTMQSESVEVQEFNRTIVDPWPFAGVDPSSGQPFVATNAVSLVTTRVEAAGSSETQRRPELRLSFAPGRSVTLVQPEAAIDSAAHDRFAFDECSIEQLALRGVPSPDVVLKQRSALAGTVGGGLKWEAIAVEPQGTAIRVRARGEIVSLMQDGRQALPSAAAEWWSASPASKGVLGGLALFVLFAGGVFLKRALDVLSKAVLPDIQK